MINPNEIKKDDVFSEISHYSYVEPVGNGQAHKLLHKESGKEITLDTNYLVNLTKTADQYQTEVKVGKEDKFWTAKQIKDAETKGELATNHVVRVGDVRVAGIRTIWENIYSSQVFAVCFQKAHTELSDKKYNELRVSQIQTGLDTIAKAKAGKTGVAEAASKVLKEIQDNPIMSYIPGEMRVLRGYKIQFASRDGRYDCVDMDLKAPDNIRPVNINTIQWLVFDGVKYTLE